MDIINHLKDGLTAIATDQEDDYCWHWTEVDSPDCEKCHYWFPKIVITGHGEDRTCPNEVYSKDELIKITKEVIIHFTKATERPCI